MGRPEKPIHPAVVILVCVAGVGGLAYLGWSEAQGPSRPPAGEVVTIAALNAAYLRNEVAATGRFRGNRVQVAGTVMDLGISLGDPWVELRDPTDSSRVRLDFDEKRKGRVAPLERGAEFSADCVVRGPAILGGIYLEDCW